MATFSRTHPASSSPPAPIPGSPPPWRSWSTSALVRLPNSASGITRKKNARRSPCSTAVPRSDRHAFPTVATAQQLLVVRIWFVTPDSANLSVLKTEPRRDCRRLYLWRGWSHDEEGIDEILS